MKDLDRVELIMQAVEYERCEYKASQISISPSFDNLRDCAVGPMRRADFCEVEVGGAVIQEHSS